MAELWRRAQGVNIYLSSALQMSLLAPGTGGTLGWRVDERCAALGLHCACLCTRDPTVCTEPAETHLSTPQVLQEHQEKGVGWGPGGGRAVLQLTLQPCSPSHQEMLDIMKSIYDMMGKYTYPAMREEAPREHVENFFQVS